MPHLMRTKNFSRHIVAMQRAKEDGTLRVTTDEAGLIIARYKGNERILVAYNLYTEQSYVLVYDHLDMLRAHETNQPLLLAAILCDLYQKA